METLTLRPKRDRRRQPRIQPTDIAHRAYELYAERGGDHGRDWDDWLRAEQELRESSKSSSPPDHRDGGLDFFLKSVSAFRPHPTNV
jgi:hypothetical protein